MWKVVMRKLVWQNNFVNLLSFQPGNFCHLFTLLALLFSPPPKICLDFRQPGHNDVLFLTLIFMLLVLPALFSIVQLSYIRLNLQHALETTWSWVTFYLNIHKVLLYFYINVLLNETDTTHYYETCLSEALGVFLYG